LSSAAGLAQAPATPPTADSSALSALLAEAARVNSQIPDRLRAYRARIETEMSIVVLDSGGRERTTQLEQIASDVRWRAPDRYDQRVVGYRSQSIGPTFSLMSFFGGWTVPTLYGNRLQLGVTAANDPNKVVNAARRSLAIHPLAANRDLYYLYEGGDTAVTLYSNARRIPIARVRVTPRPTPPGDAILFLGEMYLDADWKQIVRMRGRLVEVRNGKVTITAGSRLPGVSGASFVELVNLEVNGEYWLPAFQRTEIQARIALFGDFRTIVRIVSRFEDYRANDSSWTGPEAPPGVQHNLTFASNADQQRFKGWQRPIGAASSDVYYGELNDLAPAEWRTRKDFIFCRAHSARSFGSIASRVCSRVSPSTVSCDNRRRSFPPTRRLVGRGPSAPLAAHSAWIGKRRERRPVSASSACSPTRTISSCHSRGVRRFPLYSAAPTILIIWIGGQGLRFSAGPSASSSSRSSGSRLDRGEIAQSSRISHADCLLAQARGFVQTAASAKEIISEP
jgi:lipoprotein-anchoring transpeptidase ErfK/SrfK